MSPPLHVVRAGVGPRVLFIHGSATDGTTWSIQLRTSALCERFTLIAYDRRPAPTVEDYAREAAELVAAEGEVPILVVGSSFGSVIALELARTRPELVRGAVLIEPPMPATDDAPASAMAFLAEFDRRVAELGGPAAAEFFLRFVLGDATFERIPPAFRERSMARWEEIRVDSAALLAYRPRYGELATMAVPTLLLGGERSAPYFRATLDALLGALPRARLEIVPYAGHMLHAEAPRRFSDLLIRFADEVGIS